MRLLSDPYADNNIAVAHEISAPAKQVSRPIRQENEFKCFIFRSTRKGRDLVDKAKSFCISKGEVWEAYKRVKANQGVAEVDGQSITAFEEDLKDNLFKIWNRNRL